MSAWSHGWRIVRARPVTFAAYLAHYLAFYALPLGGGLVLRALLDALSGHARAGLGVWSLIALLAAVEAARLTVITTTVWFGARFHQGLAALLRGNVLAWLVAGPAARTRPPSAGEAVSRLSDDVDAVDDFMEAWIDLPGEMLLCLAALGIMFAIDAPITAVVVLPLVGVVTLTDRLAAWLQRLVAEAREAGARVAGFVAEAFAALTTIRLAGAEERVLARLAALNEVRRRAAVRDQMAGAILDGLAANIAGLGAGLVLLLAASAMRRGDFTVGDFALFVSYVALAGGGPRWIGRILARGRQADVSTRRLEALMEGAPSPALTSRRPASAATSPLAPLQDLAVVGLTLRHPASGRGVEDATFALRRGAFTVVTGRIGAGKTTLLKALLGLAPREGGEIAWNGRAVAEPATAMIPPRCAYTPQAPRLFSETLRDNILLGWPAGDEALAGAIELAVFEADVAAMPRGLETLVGARGVTLSGGQAQRAAAARMFVRGADLMVFDDLSSALDVETEAALWRRLDAQPGPTILAVSHRREALRRADQILVMQDGRIVARGTAQALLSDPRFAAIWGDRAGE